MRLWLPTGAAHSSEDFSGRHFAPTTLAEIFNQYEMPGITSTVYHFGFSQQDDQMKTYAYRSTSGFRSQELPYGLAVKPEMDFDAVDLGSRESDDDQLVLIMDEQRSSQRSLPLDERVLIGGVTQVWQTTGEGISVRTPHRFADYHSDREIMCAKIKRR